MSTPRRGLLVGDRHDAAAIRLTLRPQGLLAPLDQPTSTPVGPGRRALVLPGFHAQGSPPGRAGYDYLGNRKTPRAGLSPAGSMLLWAALERRSNASGPRAEESASPGAAVEKADGHEAAACMTLEAVTLARSESARSVMADCRPLVQGESGVRPADHFPIGK
jgi:hypothetical protein